MYIYIYMCIYIYIHIICTYMCTRHASISHQIAQIYGLWMIVDPTSNISNIQIDPTSKHSEVYSEASSLDYGIMWLRQQSTIPQITIFLGGISINHSQSWLV